MHHSNVDDTEIKKFTDEQVQWWDPQGPMQLLHAINPLRLQYTQSHTALKAKKVADIGCGGGIFAEALAQQQAFVTAIDMNASAIETAAHHAQEQGLHIEYQRTTAEALANQYTNHFHVVTCLEMLEHVPDPQAIIQACSTLTQPGGYVIFSTLNRTLRSFTEAIIGAEYILQLLPKGTHEYRKFIRPSELQTWATQCGLQFQHIQGIRMNPLTRDMQLCDNLQTNYLACYQKPAQPND